ncbi:hypothetical protein A6U89_11330 [Agrobacterium sp. B133/95]|nr:hypothetical protein A6U89_11330 [Agrobacterium sp. B133/95]
MPAISHLPFIGCADESHLSQSDYATVKRQPAFTRRFDRMMKKNSKECARAYQDRYRAPLSA